MHSRFINKEVSTESNWFSGSPWTLTILHDNCAF